jgi:hypothetical protein
MRQSLRRATALFMIVLASADLITFIPVKADSMAAGLAAMVCGPDWQSVGRRR